MTEVFEAGSDAVYTGDSGLEIEIQIRVNDPEGGADVLLAHILEAAEEAVEADNAAVALQAAAEAFLVATGDGPGVEPPQDTWDAETLEGYR